MKNIGNKWFTLVELLITIVILTILWTIAMITYMWYSRVARDTTRTWNLEQISSQLDLNKAREWYFPIPENYSNISYEWDIIWRQGSLWKNVRDQIEFFVDELEFKYEHPIDYDYSVSIDWRKYQVGTIYEDRENF